jgi:hypothetical protein
MARCREVGLSTLISYFSLLLCGRGMCRNRERRATSMPALRIMVQGTGSYVGKSVLTGALCRYF